jgi:hypothetical protein
MQAAQREAPRRPALNRYGPPLIAEIAGDEAQGSPASLRPAKWLGGRRRPSLSMRAMADARTPVATTSRIIPLIMDET